VSEREPTAAERHVQETLRALPRPHPDVAFRARLRQEFTSGQIGGQRGLQIERPWYARGALWAPVAAGILLAAFVVANRGPDWQVLATGGSGAIIVDGVTYSSGEGDLQGHREPMTERLRRGGRVQLLGGQSLDLVVPGVLALSLSPGADVTLSAAPNRWFPRDMNVAVARGNSYFSTGRRFHGAHLDVRTAEGSARAVGTSFAVLCGVGETCVCVMEGRVKVALGHAPVANGVDVPQGMRRVLHGDGAETLPILTDSVERLQRQIAAAGPQLERE
jgi:hypothetical protein